MIDLTDDSTLPGRKILPWESSRGTRNHCQTGTVSVRKREDGWSQCVDTQAAGKPCNNCWLQSHRGGGPVIGVQIVGTKIEKIEGGTGLCGEDKRPPPSSESHPPPLAPHEPHCVAPARGLPIVRDSMNRRLQYQARYGYLSCLRNPDHTWAECLLSPADEAEGDPIPLRPALVPIGRHPVIPEYVQSVPPGEAYYWFSPVPSPTSIAS